MITENNIIKLVESINKNILNSFDEKKELNKNIFIKNDENYVMNNDIRKALLSVTNEFIDFLNVDFFIHDVILTGSLANFNWSKYSDIDLHIIIDFDETGYEYEILKEFFDAKKTIWNDKRNIIIKGFDVELYVQDLNEKHISTGVFSILNNKWLTKPEKINPKIDFKRIMEKVDYFTNTIDNLISAKNININDVERVNEKLKKFRKIGLDKDGEYSYENLTFKVLRRNGYIEKLFKLKNKLIDKKLSIQQ